MSFILDALKKSELERQRQSAPGLIEMPVAARRRRIPVWVWVLAGLLCVNMTVLLALVLRSPASDKIHTAAGTGGPSPPAPREPATREPTARESIPNEPTAPQLSARNPPSVQNLETYPPEAPADAGQDTRSADHFSPLDNQPVYAPEIPVQDETTGSTPTTATPNVAAPAAPAHTNHRTDPVLHDEPSENEEMLPTISELNLTGAQTLPEIHLDVHVYATRAADRFVYINMRKYREGAVLQEGPTLERIRRDGVVLNYNGLRFLVPRQ